MKIKTENEVTLQFPSQSSNEGFIRSAVACFAAQMDPTLNELEDIKTAVSEAATNAIVHAYPDRIGKVTVKVRICTGQVHHRRRGTQRHGLHHHGELYG